MSINAMTAVAEAVAGLSPRDIGELILALPLRAERTDDERNVSAGLHLAFVRSMRELLADAPTADLLAMSDATTDDDGRYLDGGEGLDGPTNQAIDDVLERRYPGSDAWEMWETCGDYLPTEHPHAGARYKQFTHAYWTQIADESGKR